MTATVTTRSLTLLRPLLLLRMVVVVATELIPATAEVTVQAIPAMVPVATTLLLLARPPTTATPSLFTKLRRTTTRLSRLRQTLMPAVASLRTCRRYVNVEGTIIEDSSLTFIVTGP